MGDPQDSSCRKSKNEAIEQYLNERYDFRFNTIKSKPEFRIQGDPASFRSVNKYHINSFKREMDAQIALSSSSENIRTILESSFALRVNPVQEYFQQLKALSPAERGNIDALAGTVKVYHAELWKKHLTKWLVAVMANALHDVGCQNHTCLVLTGAQGKFKTTFLDLLCPNSLKSYLFTGKIDPQSKDVQTLIAEYLFINIDDQLKALNRRDENELKNLITTPCVKYRRPYDVYIEEYPHLASFMASVNGNDFLTDPTGSRRFLPFEVLEIDIQAAKQINMDLVFSEIKHLYELGFQYWFDDAEIQELHQFNAEFQVQTEEYEMLIQGFEKPNAQQAKHCDCFLTTTQICNHLQGYTQVRLSVKRMGEALRRANFERLSKRINNTSVYGYNVNTVSPNPFIHP